MSKKQEFTYELVTASPAGLVNIRTHYSQLEYLPKVMYKNASRYKNLRTIQNDTTKKIVHETWFQKFVDKSAEDEYFVVTKFEEGRLDIISNNYYGTPTLWWVIAMANYIMDPFEIPLGTQLRIPPLISLYNEGGVLSG